MNGTTKAYKGKTCKTCYRDFTPESPNAQTCLECRPKNKEKNHVYNLFCRHCLKEFQASRGYRFCSVQCKELSYTQSRAAYLDEDILIKAEEAATSKRLHEHLQKWL